MKKFYHASGIKFNSGTVLTTSGGRGHNSSFSEAARGGRLVGVYMTDKVTPHHSIAALAYAEQWYVHEVIPQGRVWYDRNYGEWCADSAIVVSCVKRLTPVVEKIGKKMPGSGRVPQRSRWAFMPVDKRPPE